MTKNIKDSGSTAIFCTRHVIVTTYQGLPITTPVHLNWLEEPGEGEKTTSLLILQSKGVLPRIQAIVHWKTQDEPLLFTP